MLSRIRRLWFPAVLGLIVSLPAPASAQDYPNRPVKIIVGFKAGGTTDVMARLLADFLSRKTGQAVIVENRPGAGGDIASGVVVRAKPDGYTLLVAPTGNIVINQWLQKSMAFDPVNDLRPISPFTEAQQYLAVSSKVPAADIHELIKLAKSKPNTLTYASAGQGSTTHLGMLLFADSAGVNLIHVPYNGADAAVLDVAAGRVDMINVGLRNLLPHIQSGTIKVMVVASRNHSAAMPKVPNAAEAGVPDYEISNWYGLFAPKDTPDAIAQYLHQSVAEMFASEPVKKSLETMMEGPMEMKPDEFQGFIRHQADVWKRLITKVGIEPR